MSDVDQQDEQRAPQSRKNRQRTKTQAPRRQQNFPYGNSTLDESNMQQVGNPAANNVAPPQPGGGSKSGSESLKLRLDLNLEVEITLKARIHGDLTLALL
jgi:hypothetical protein